MTTQGTTQINTISIRSVGKSELSVSVLGFGGGTIGSPQIDNPTSIETVHSAWDSGVRFFDTAPWYGLGRSERRLGLSLSGKDDRDTYHINTKVGKTLVPEPHRVEANHTLSPGGEVRTPRDSITGFRVKFDYSYEQIHRQHLDSLQRLGHSKVDSLTIHDIDYGYHTQSQIENHLNQLSGKQGGGARALEELRQEGKIKAIGCGCNLESRNEKSWNTDQHESLIEKIVDLVDLDFVVIAGGYTLLETRALRRILPLCTRYNIGVIIAAPFASGWLVDPGQATYMYSEPSTEIAERSKKIQAICQHHDTPMAAVALQFPLAHPAVASVIPGAKSPAEPQQNKSFLDFPVPGDIWTELREQNLIDAEAPVPS